MKKIASVLLLGLICPMLLCAQGETSNWYFGTSSGLVFNGDGSVAPVEVSSLNTLEGCASISDDSGNLLFYTDGITVYDRSHAIMANGNGLYGDPSSTQSAIIVPKPDAPDIFYIFTVDTSVGARDPDFGLNYSVVNMGLGNGMGEVTEKNKRLLNDCAEKIAAVIKDCNEQSIWLIALASEDGRTAVFNTYHAFEINRDGLKRTAVKSSFPGFQVTDPRGYLKISADGSKLASAHVLDGLHLFDFDVESGKLSTPRRILINDSNRFPYGLEFSPDNRFLYVHSSNNHDPLDKNGHNSSLLQYDLNQADIANSVVVLDKRPIYRGALQLGVNGKIYRTIAKSYLFGTPFLGVINNPTAKGTEADYAHEAIRLNGNATQGLPPFIQSFFQGESLTHNGPEAESGLVVLCYGQELNLQAIDIPDATYRWTKDGESFEPSSANQFLRPQVTAEDSGYYVVTIESTDPDECPVRGQAFVNVLPVPPEDIALEICDFGPGDTEDGITTVNLEKAVGYEDIDFYFYETLQDREEEFSIPTATSYRNTVPFNQRLYYRAVNELGCENLGEINLSVAPVSVGPSTFGPVHTCDSDPQDNLLSGVFDLELVASLYPGISVRFFDKLEDIAAGENELSDSYSATSGTLFASLEADGKCLGVERISLVVNPLPQVTLQEEYTVCTDGDPTLISAPPGLDTYQWYSDNGGPEAVISDSREVVISEPGVYYLSAGMEYGSGASGVVCEQLIPFSVNPSSKATISSVEIADFSENNSVQILVEGDGSYEFSMDGSNYQESNRFEQVPAGIYTFFIKDSKGCGISTKEISVLGYPKFFTPNGDGVNDYWQISGVDDVFRPEAVITIYDRYGALITQITPYGKGWDGNTSDLKLPAADYWFRVSLKNGREVTGHFALKR